MNRPALLACALLATTALGDLAPPPAPETEAAPAEARHPMGVENAPSGVISGGWEYVYAAYTLGTLGVLTYAVSLVLRRPTQPNPRVVP